MIQWLLQHLVFHDADKALHAQIVYVFCSFFVFISIGVLVHGASSISLRARQVALGLVCTALFCVLLAIAYHFHVPSAEMAILPDFCFDAIAACFGFYAGMHKLFHRPAPPVLSSYEAKLEARLEAIIEEARIARDRVKRPWMYHHEPYGARSKSILDVR
jgi:hypothetical protein